MQNYGVYWIINVNYGALLFSAQSGRAVWVGEGVGSVWLVDDNWLDENGYLLGKSFFP